MQRKMMESLFEGKNSETVLNEGVSRALEIADRAIMEVKMRRVDPRELVISKRLRKDLYEYRARQPHIVAAMLGKEVGENSDYILLNTKRKNPYLRVMPVSLLYGRKKGYDKKKYAEMTRRAAWNLLRPFVPNEKFIGENQYRNMSLLNFIDN
jgi:DNA polymerase elongation subunit (family B)